MNVANLQLEGLLMAVASINQVLVRKGVLSVEEIDIALRRAEASETGEERSEGMSASSRDAVNFPIRLLELANRCQPEAFGNPPIHSAGKNRTMRSSGPFHQAAERDAASPFQRR